MGSKIYLAIILSDYQELNLKRYIDHLKVKDELIVFNGRFKGVNFEKKIIKFSKNVTTKNFSNKYILLFYFFFVLLKNLFHQKKFIFGNPDGQFNNFLRKFIDGKNQTYVDDGLITIYYDFNQLKKDCTIFTVYDVKLPSKLKKIRYFPKYKKKKKKTCDQILLIGFPHFKLNTLSKDKFVKIMNILSKKNIRFYYYPHKFEIEELLLLPKNFVVIKRRSSVEQYIYNYKYDFKFIYSFSSSCIIEILNFYKKEKIKLFDINNLIGNSDFNNERKKILNKCNNYLRKLKIRIIKFKQINI